MNQDQRAQHGTKLSGAPPKWIYFAVFTISGFSGLIYESIWSHYLKLFLGHAAYAQSLVLIIFMGGLALGSWLSARFSYRIRRPILVYAIVEGVIGVIALLFHGLFVALSDTFYFSLLPALDAPLLGALLKWTAAAALIFPQSLLLGMTFPLMSSGILRRYPGQPGGSLAMLYFTNSIGAAIGVLISGFWLIGAVGLPGTIMTAGLLNIALAVVVYVLVRLDPEPDCRARVPVPGGGATMGVDGLAMLFFVAAGVTGAASFVYEIGWIRMLSLVLGSTTHSFELMLSAFITGLAFGGLWIKRRIDRIDDPVRFAGWVQVWMGAMAILTVPLYVQTFDWMAAMLAGLQRSEAGFNLFTAMSHGIALVVMVPTTFLAGMTLPLFTHVLMRGRQGERAIGRIYAANTFGAIVGVLFAVHIGLPLLGLESLIAFGAALDVLLGVALLYRGAGAPELAPAMRGALVGASVLVLVVATIDLDPKRLASGVYRYNASELDEETRVIYYEDGKTASISLSVRGSRRTISTNGKPDASLEMADGEPATTDEITMVMAGALPLAYSPDARQVANIGLGSGLTTHTLLAVESIERIDTVEIEPAMVAGARGFGERVARTFTDPRSRIHIEDAKTFFSLENSSYDVIIAEPSNPWVSGVATLFSDEFYRMVRTHLADDGILVQWLQLYEFNDELALSVLRALSENFSDFAIYNTDDVNILIVAKRGGALGEPQFSDVFKGRLRPELARVGLHRAEDFLVRRTATGQVVDGLLAQAGVPANSDYFPFLDLNAGEARFQGQVATMFIRWATATLPVLEMLGVSEFDLSQVSAATTFYRATRIVNAHRLHEALLDPHGGVQWQLRLPVNHPLTAFNLLIRSCEPQAEEEHWLAGLHGLAESTLPYLNAPAAVDLLETVLPAACLEQAPERLRAWHTLYLAVARRSATDMVSSAERVLAVDVPAERTPYAVATAMLGYLCAGRPEAALALWDDRRRYAQDIQTTPEIELMLRMAHANQPPSDPER